MKKYIIPSLIIILIITSVIAGIWLLTKDSPYTKQELAFLKQEGFLNEQGLVSKSSTLIEQNLNSPDESFEVLATKLDENTYQLAFKLENKSNQSKEFYLIPISESSQTEFKEIKGRISGLITEVYNTPLAELYGVEEHKLELKPELAQAYDDIEKNGYTAKPIKLVLDPNSILIAQSKWEINRDRVSDSLEPVYLLVYGSAGGAKDNLIEITRALHLDENKNIVSNIYEQVKKQDNYWSEAIPAEHYVRVTFEKPLDNSRDITIYARSANNNPAEIEVYLKDSNDLVAKFENIKEEKIYKIYLTELIGSYDVFDLKIKNNPVEFDHIIDPSYTVKSGVVYDSATAYNNGRRLARSSDGALHVVWTDKRGTNYQIYYAKSTDGGENWTETAITSENYDQYNPSIAIDSNDYIHIAWYGRHSGSTTYFQIRYIKYTTSWQAIENLTSGDYDQYYPSIAIDSNNYIHIAWYGKHSGSITIFQIRYIKYTTSWQAIENLTSGDYYQYYPSIAIDSNDYIHIAWYGRHSGSATYNQIRYIKYTTSWQAIENLTSESYHQNNPSIAIDSNNYIHITWDGQHSGSTTYYQIRYIKYTTSWQSIENLTSAGDNQYQPGLIWANYPVVSGLKTNRPKNGYAFVWTDTTDTNSVIFYKSTDLDWDTPPEAVRVKGGLRVKGGWKVKF